MKSGRETIAPTSRHLPAAACTITCAKARAREDKDDGSSSGGVFFDLAEVSNRAYYRGRGSWKCVAGKEKVGTT